MCGILIVEQGALTMFRTRIKMILNIYCKVKIAGNGVDFV